MKREKFINCKVDYSLADQEVLKRDIGLKLNENALKIEKDEE